MEVILYVLVAILVWFGTKVYYAKNFEGNKDLSLPPDIVLGVLWPITVLVTIGLVINSYANSLATRIVNVN